MTNVPALNIRVRQHGIEEGIRALRAIAERRAPGAVNRGLHEELELVLRESKRLVPKDTHSLERSGKVLSGSEAASEAGVGIGADGIAATIGYGGPSSPNYVDYALYVHENLFARHPNGGQAKFLEQPFMEALPGLLDRLAVRVRRAL